MWIRDQLIVYNMGVKNMNNQRSGKKPIRRALFLLTGALESCYVNARENMNKQPSERPLLRRGAKK